MRSLYISIVTIAQDDGYTLTQSHWTNGFRAMREGLEPELSVAMMQPLDNPFGPEGLLPVS